MKAKCIPLLITVSPAPGSTWKIGSVQEMYAERKELRQEGKNERRVKGQEPFFMNLCTCPEMFIHRLHAYSGLSLLVTHSSYQIYIECLLCTRCRRHLHMTHACGLRPEHHNTGHLIPLRSPFPSITWPTKYPPYTGKFLREGKGHHSGK